MKEYFLTINRVYADKYKLDKELVGKSIVLYHNQIPHFEKHKKEFIDEDSYLEAKNGIKYILENPEFIVKDNKNNSLLFVKKMTDNNLVVVRISNKKELKVRTLYPINENKKRRLLSKVD